MQTATYGPGETGHRNIRVPATLDNLLDGHRQGTWLVSLAFTVLAVRRQVPSATWATAFWPRWWLFRPSSAATTSLLMPTFWRALDGRSGTARPAGVRHETMSRLSESALSRSEGYSLC